MFPEFLELVLSVDHSYTISMDVVLEKYEELQSQFALLGRDEDGMISMSDAKVRLLT